MLVINPAIASATPGDTAVMPLIGKFRACDFTLEKWVSAHGYTRGVAHLSTSGQNVVANVDLATAEPDTRYDVRIIQTPRASIGCAPGAPGVITGSVQTDASGAGSTTLQGPIDSSATGAWVMVQRPSPSSLTPAEFYTSEFIASI
ncbi:hypothetical protein CIW52_00275 [Mycolicibacterium sp. P9-64]|nr:hypothetical protein CIW52_00275 [Mycolicibacterium sp. P9-64]